MHYIYKFIGIVVWIVGIIFANGFWSTFFAFFIPFWAWYLTIEHLLLKYNIL